MLHQAKTTRALLMVLRAKPNRSVRCDDVSGRSPERRVMKRPKWPYGLLILIAVVILAFPVRGTTQESGSFMEDFLSTVYKDELGTTAYWDTLHGELKLFPFELTLAGGYDTPDVSYGVAISGDYAYVADAYAGLQVIDISDPATPTFAGSYNTPGHAYGVAISGDYAYVADGPPGLQVIDISDPTAPTFAGNYDTPCSTYCVAISGDYAYAVSGSCGLQVIDISDPTTPTFAGNYDTPGSAYGVAISGDYAYVADGFSGLQVVDISDPTTPTFAGNYDTPDFAYRVTISGDYAYVGDRMSGLQVIDISDPTAPMLAGSYDTPGYAYGVGISGDYAYVADVHGGVQVIDISDPTTPMLAGSYDTPGSARDVAIAGDYTYVADWASGLQVIKIAQPVVPPILAGTYNTPGQAYGVTVAGDYAYVADWGRGLQVIDISEPTTPTLAGEYNTLGYSWHVAVAGDYAYVADGYDGGLQVIDISDPTSPAFAGSYDTPGNAYGVAIAGDYAYVADGSASSGVQVIDISDPTTPSLAGSFSPLLGPATHVAVEGDYAYVTAHAAGLWVMDISDPTTPSLAGVYDTPGIARWVTISGDYAYVADDGGGLQVIDISDPTAPTPVGSYTTSYDPTHPARFVAIAGDYAYVGKGNAELQVFDVSDPTTPTLIGTYDTPGGYYAAVVAGDYLYVADSGGGLRVMQIFERSLDLDDNVAQSLTLNSLPSEISRVRLSTVQTGSILWEMSANGGADWEEVVAGTPRDTLAIWDTLAVPGNDLRWRSTHVYDEVGVNPTCDTLFIEWEQFLADDDGDGVPNVSDACPTENASFFDRNGDGCIDEWISTRHTCYWPPEDLPFEYWIHENGAYGISDGTDFTAVQDGINRWTTLSGVDFSVDYLGTTTQNEAKNLDGVNLVTFEDPDLLFLSNVLAVGLTTTFIEPTVFDGRVIRPGQIVDADMIFNKQKTFSTTTMGSGPDIESIATHEAGHLFGLGHSAVMTSTMFYILPPGKDAVSLSPEDSTMFFKSYPDSAEVAGANVLTGTVRDSVTSKPVPGAIVFAISATSGDTLGCEYTLPAEILPAPGMPQEGSFCFSGLPDGPYYVAIYPLNGTSPIKFLEAYNVSFLLDTTAVENFVAEYWDIDESASDDCAAMSPISLVGGDSVHVELILNVDTTRPAVLAVTPQDGAGDVRSDAAVLIAFSEPIDVSSVSTSSFSLAPSLGGTPVGGLASFPRVKDDSLLAFTPFAALDFNTTYRLTLEASIKDQFGNSLGNSFVSEFTVEDQPPVSISSLLPSEGIVGSIVTISGLGFSSVAEEDTVLFSGVKAVVRSAQPNQLVVIVPEGIPTGALVSVKIGLDESNQLTFTVLPATEVARGVETGVLDLGSRPRSLAVRPDGSRVYVATEKGLSSVIVEPGATFLDYESVTMVCGVDELSMNPQGDRIYAVSRADSALHVIDVSNPMSTIVLQTLPVGAEPRGIVVDQKGERAYVTTDASEIQIWDISHRRLATQAHAEQIATIASPDPNLRKAMAVDPVGNRLLTLSGIGKVLIFDLSGDSLLADVPVGTDPRDIVVDPFAKRAYVSDATGMVTAVRLDHDPPSNDGNIYTSGSPLGIAITSAGRFLYAANHSLDLLQAIDLLVGSATYRTVAAAIPHRSRPIDVEISPDGAYAYSIADGQDQFVVTTIGIGPTLKSLSRIAGTVGAQLVLSGDGFGTDPLQILISFNGMTTTADWARETALSVTVPPGATSGPVAVERSTPAGPTVSNSLPFEVLSPSSGVLRLAAQLAPPNGPELEQVIAASPKGDLLIVAERTPVPAAHGRLHILDLAPGSATFNQFLGTEAVFDTSVVDITVSPDGKRAFVVLSARDTISVIDVDRYSTTFGERVAVIAPGAFPLPTLRVFTLSPDGQLGLATGGNVTNIVDLVEGSPTEYQAFHSVNTVSDVNAAAFHPLGTTAYLMDDNLPPTIRVLDLDSSSVDFGNLITTVPILGPPGAGPRSVSFTPDGNRCLVLMSGSSGPAVRWVITLDTGDPHSPVVSYQQDFDPGTDPAAHEEISVSPRGDRAVFHIRDVGFKHIDLTTLPYLTVETVVDFLHLGDWDIGYAPDAKQFYGVSADNDSIYVFDFNYVQTLAIQSGDLQTGVVNMQLALPLCVKVVDGSANPVQGIPVMFDVKTGAGVFPATNSSTQVVATDAKGIARAMLQLGDTAGDSANSVEAKARGLAGSPVTFYANAILDPLTQPLTFLTITPSDGTSNVDILTAIQMTFNRGVDPASVNNSTFYLHKSTEPSTAVPAIIGFADLNRKLSFSPIAALETNTTYVVEATGGLRDESGGALDSAVESSFSTEPPPPLSLVSVAPPSATVATTVILSGMGFDPVLENNTVLFKDKEAQLLDGYVDFLKVIVPLGATTDSVRVITPNGTSNALYFGVLATETSPVDEVVDCIKTDSATRAIAINPSGTWAYAISSDPPVVIPIDIVAKASYPGIPVGANPMAIAVHPNGKYAYVANFGSNSVTVVNIDPTDPQHFNTPDTTVIVGANPIDLVASPLGDRVYVANLRSSDISVLDVEEGSSTFNFVIDSGPVSKGARAVAMNPSGTRLYVGTDDGYVVLDPLQHLMVVSGTDSKQTTKQVVMSPAGTRLFVLTTEGDVVMYDIEPGSPTENQVTDSVTGKGAKTVSMSPAGGLLYVTLETDQVLVFLVEEASNLAVIEDSGTDGISKLTLINEFYLGNDLSGIVFDPSGSGLALASSTGDEIVLILNVSDISVGTLEATIDVSPRILNLSSRGRWISGRIELTPSPPFFAQDIDISTVLLEGTIPAQTDNWVIEDSNLNGIEELVLKFDRALFQSSLPQGDSVEVTITGMVGTRTFSGLDTIRTIRPTVKFPSGGEILVAGSLVNVSWTSPADYQVSAVDVHWSPDDGGVWYAIAENIPDAGSVPWLTPSSRYDSCRVMVTLYSNGADLGMGMSQELFVIQPVLAVTVTSFSGIIKKGTPVIKWTTGLESNISGFHLFRSKSDVGEYEQLTSGLIPSKGLISGSDYEFNDRTARPNREYFYKLQQVSGLGDGQVFGPFKVVFKAPFSLDQNFPNPFNPNTTIRFTIPYDSHVKLAIYDVTGRLVKELINEKKEADFYEVVWDGSDMNGERIASGVYFYHLAAGNLNRTRKMIILR